MRPALGEQHSRSAQRNGSKTSPESDPLAEAPEGQLTETADILIFDHISSLNSFRMMSRKDV